MNDSMTYQFAEFFIPCYSFPLGCWISTKNPPSLCFCLIFPVSCLMERIMEWLLFERVPGVRFFLTKFPPSGKFSPRGKFSGGGMLLDRSYTPSVARCLFSTLGVTWLLPGRNTWTICVHMLLIPQSWTLLSIHHCPRPRRQWNRWPGGGSSSGRIPTHTQSSSRRTYWISP